MERVHPCRITTTNLPARVPLLCYHLQPLNLIMVPKMRGMKNIKMEKITVTMQDRLTLRFQSMIVTIKELSTRAKILRPFVLILQKVKVPLYRRPVPNCPQWSNLSKWRWRFQITSVLLLVLSSWLGVTCIKRRNICNRQNGWRWSSYIRRKG